MESRGDNLVSIVIPTRNRRELLSVCLTSIKAQTCPEWECIVVDDHSTDETEALVRCFSQEDSRFSFLRLGGDRSGANAARNLGLQSSSGNLVLFLDSDDALDSTCLQVRAGSLQSLPELDFGVFPTLLFRKEPGDSDLLWNIEAPDDDLDRFLSLDIPWQTGSVLWRRTSLLRLGPWLETLPCWQDWEFHVRALRHRFKYRRFSEGNSYWRVPRTDSLWRNSNGQTHFQARLKFTNLLILEMQDEDDFTDHRKRLLGGLYFWHARHQYSKLRKRVDAMVTWTRAWKLGLVPAGQYFEGLRWFSRTTRGPHDNVKEVFPHWPQEFRTGRSFTLHQVSQSLTNPPSSRRRVGIFIDEWRDGGVPVFLERLERTLSEAGHEVFLFLAHPYPKRDEISRQLYLRLKSRLGGRCVSLNYKSHPPAWRKSHLRNVILSYGVSCLLINHFYTYADDLLSLSSDLALISVAHTDLDYYYAEYLRAMDYTRAHIVVSQRIQEKTLLLTAPGDAHRIHYIPYGIEESSRLFQPEREGSFRVVYCARLDFAQKRCQDLVPIWKQFVTLGGKGELIILGTGRGADFLRTEFAEEISRGEVQMHSQVSTERVLEEMARSDVLLNISNYEGLPQVVLEGASLGLFPLLSDIESGHREIVARLGFGNLCHVGDNAAFAQELLRLYTKLPATRRHRGTIREAALQHYSLKKACRLYGELIDQISSTASPPFKVVPQRKELADRVRRFFLWIKYRRHFAL